MTHPTEPPDTPDVVVVGAGALGLSSAWRCALAGLDVTICDPNPGRGASWAAAGMLAPVTELHYGEEPLLRLNLASSQRWPSFADEVTAASGRDIGYRPTGTLTVARDTDDLAVLTDLEAFQRSLGLRVERLRSRECRELEPMLNPGVRGGLLAPDDHQVDNRALVAALLVAVERAGVRLRRQAVTEVEHDGDRVRGVVLDNGERISAGHVVLAAGWASSDVKGLPAEDVVAVRPVKGQLLHLRARPATLAGVSESIAARNIRGLDVYLVPRADGRLVVGATVEEVGLDRTTTAGGVFELLRAARELVPGIAELELVEIVAGLRPGSPDNAPLLGSASLEGLIVATGHYRNGILLTPITSAAVAALVTGAAPPVEIGPFDPLRVAEMRST